MIDMKKRDVPPGDLIMIHNVPTGLEVSRKIIQSNSNKKQTADAVRKIVQIDSNQAQTTEFCRENRTKRPKKRGVCHLSVFADYKGNYRYLFGVFMGHDQPGDCLIRS